MSSNASSSDRKRFESTEVALAENVASLRDSVVEYVVGLGAGEDVQASVKLAVSEALANVVVHAYAARDEPGPMTVEAWSTGDGALLVVVCDEGDGMVPRPDSPGLGLGLPLLAHMADDFRVDVRGERLGTRLSMRFSLDGSGTDLSSA